MMILFRISSHVTANVISITNKPSSAIISQKSLFLLHNDFCIGQGGEALSGVALIDSRKMIGITYWHKYKEGLVILKIL